MMLLFGAEGQKYDYEDEKRMIKTWQLVSLCLLLRNGTNFSLLSHAIKNRFSVN